MYQKRGVEGWEREQGNGKIEQRKGCCFLRLEEDGKRPGWHRAGQGGEWGDALGVWALLGLVWGATSALNPVVYHHGTVGCTDVDGTAEDGNGILMIVIMNQLSSVGKHPQHKFESHLPWQQRFGLSKDPWTTLGTSLSGGSDLAPNSVGKERVKEAPSCSVSC